MTDYTELVKALRCKRDDCEGCDLAFFDKDEGWICQYAAKDDDAADAIEDMAKHITEMHERVTVLQIARGELEAEVKRLEPKQRKLGRWEKAKPKGVVVYSDGYAECSSCHEVIWLGWGMNFCPHCGTQNKIIDPDDYDGAKMNDSNASNESNALGNAQDGPIITPCRGCSDYDGYGGCKSKGGCARAKMTEVQE